MADKQIKYSISVFDVNFKNRIFMSVNTVQYLNDFVNRKTA